jgi:alpha-glucosidase
MPERVAGEIGESQSEVAVIPDDQRQDPTFFRTGGKEIGRDGCRVPLAWTSTGRSLGFGVDGAHLPQPAWFSDHAVDVEDGDDASTLSLYRHALALRHELQSAEHLRWIDTGRDDVLWFTRPNGWQVITNFGAEPYPLPSEVVVRLSSAPETAAGVPGEATVWVTAPSD